MAQMLGQDPPWFILFSKEILTPSTQCASLIFHLTVRDVWHTVFTYTILQIVFYLDRAGILCNITTHSSGQSVWRINKHGESYSQPTGGNLSLNVSSPGLRPWTVNIEPNACS